MYSHVSLEVTRIFKTLWTIRATEYFPLGFVLLAEHNIHELLNIRELTLNHKYIILFSDPILRQVNVEVNQVLWFGLKSSNFLG